MNRKQRKIARELRGKNYPDNVLLNIKPGARIWFEEERNPYTVQASGGGFVVCTRPFAPRKTVLYTIIDVRENVRGPENLIFGRGAETPKQCRQMIARLSGAFGDKTQVSKRHGIDLKVRKIEIVY